MELINFKFSLFKLMILASLSTTAVVASAKQVYVNDFDTGHTDIIGFFACKK